MDRACSTHGGTYTEFRCENAKDVNVHGRVLEKQNKGVDWIYLEPSGSMKIKNFFEWLSKY
jgi:hypothetical protein